MNTNKVFIGYTSKFKECLLYKTNNYYIDLNNHKKYRIDGIDHNLLFPFESDIDMSKKDIKSHYKIDREQMLNLKNIFIGNVYKLYTQNISMTCKSIHGIILKKDALLMYQDKDNYYFDMGNLSINEKIETRIFDYEKGLKGNFPVINFNEKAISLYEIFNKEHEQMSKKKVMEFHQKYITQEEVKEYSKKLKWR